MQPFQLDEAEYLVLAGRMNVEIQSPRAMSSSPPLVRALKLYYRYALSNTIPVIWPLNGLSMEYIKNNCPTLLVVVNNLLQLSHFYFPSFDMAQPENINLKDVFAGTLELINE